MVKNKLLVVGFGHMGQPIASFAQDAGFDVWVLLQQGSASAAAAQVLGCNVITELTGDFAVIVLAVKPQNLQEVADDFTRYISATDGLHKAVVVSILAGTQLATIRKIFAHNPILRIMPNLTITTGCTFVAGVATPGLTLADAPQLERLLNSFGHFQLLDSEDQLDALTAIIGSGPAYIAEFIERFSVAVAVLGVPLETAELAMKMVTESTAHYLLEGGASLSNFIKGVTSKGGTTAAGLVALRDGGFTKAVASCVQLTYKRAQELQG